MIRAALKGDLSRAQSLNHRLLDVHPWLYVDGNPVGIKSAVEILGLCSNEVRLPLVSMSAEHYSQLKKVMEEVEKKQNRVEKLGKVRLGD